MSLNTVCTAQKAMCDVQCYSVIAMAGMLVIAVVAHVLGF